jgi:hypothetical protein
MTARAKTRTATKSAGDVTPFGAATLQYQGPRIHHGGRSVSDLTQAFDLTIFRPSLAKLQTAVVQQIGQRLLLFDHSIIFEMIGEGKGVKPSVGCYAT